MSDKLLEKINKMKKNELQSCLKKILKRCEKEEKAKAYTGPKSPTYCGKKATPNGRTKGSPAICIRKGVGVGKAMGVIEGVNDERNKIINLIKRS